jgi:hypothetical protein
MSSARSLLFVLSVALAATSLLSAQVLKQSDLKRVYGSRWIVLPLPDSRIAPGSIVSIKKGQVAWESTLGQCGAPADVLTVERGAGGAVEFKGDAEYGADAVLKVQGVEIGPEFSRVKKTTLKVDDHGPEALDRIKIGSWFNDPGTHLSTTCQRFLTEKDVFIVQEAYRVGKGRFALLDKNNKKIALSGLKLGPVSIGANAKANTTDDGSLEFASPVYTAVRRLKLMKDGQLKTLGQPGQESTDDSVARAIFEGRASKETRKQ